MKDELTLILIADFLVNRVARMTRRLAEISLDTSYPFYEIPIFQPWKMFIGHLVFDGQLHQKGVVILSNFNRFHSRP